MSKLKIAINNRWTGSILFEYETENNSIKKTVEEWIRKQLSEGASFANLTDANLTFANLTDANLTRANLTRANLTRANLTDANLTDANLTFANLTDANLTRANLTRANLTRANLTDANLTDANLTDANLTRANLTRANLTPIKNDIFLVLLNAIPEIAFLKQNIIEGKIDGSVYEGDCACLNGTLYNGATKINGANEEIVKGNLIKCRNASRPAERFFIAIKKGDTPSTSQHSQLALQWVEEFEKLISIR
jgi:uncharacterized protein YjbI with pentapeptide repeats